MKNKSQGQPPQPNGEIIAEFKNNLRKITKNPHKNAKTLEISSEENHITNLNGSNGSSETNKAHLKRKEISLEDNNLKKKTKKDKSISRRKVALEISEEDIESFESFETKKGSEEFKSINSKRMEYAFEEANNNQKEQSLSKKNMQMEISDEENPFSAEKNRKNGFLEEKKKEIETNLFEQKEEKTLFTIFILIIL